MEEEYNLVLIDERQESVEEIIDDYLEIIEYTKDNADTLREILYDFFDDVNSWTCRQYMIDVAKNAISTLKILDREDNHPIAEDDET